MVNFGKVVVGLVEKIKKWYCKNLEVMGVSLFKVFVEIMFFSFEEDMYEIIKWVLDMVK